VARPSKSKKKQQPVKQPENKPGKGANKSGWKPGQSGNPRGRPPNPLSLTAATRTVLAWDAPETVVQTYQQFFPSLPTAFGHKPTCVEILACRGVVKAMDIKTGDVMHKEINDRVDGRVALPIQGAGDGPPIAVKFDFNDMPVDDVRILRRLLGQCQVTEQE